ncbi:MAG: alkaline phosphatase family protein [Acetobacteraceae bacterium]
MRFIIVVLDGLRPDFVTEAAMPNLAALASDGTRFANARSVFPSETRVATSSLLTGCRPGAHGLVANTMFVPSVTPLRKLRTNLPADLALLGQGGSPLERPTLGERLAGDGLALAVVSGGSAGSAVLTHPLATRLGAFRWNVGDLDGPTAARVRAALGPTPAAAVPNLARADFAAAVLTELVLPELRPDIALLWCPEPDVTFHFHGLGSAEAQAALHGADAIVGQVRAWRDRQPDAAEIGLIVMSDHGHVTGDRRIDLAAELRQAGFAVGDGFTDGAELVVTASASPGLFLRDPGLAPAIAAFLAAQDWAGPLLARDPELLPGTASLAALGSAHMRSADLVLLFAGSEAPDDLGVPGRAPYDAGDVPVGGGMHGGLHRRELATVLVLDGGPFRRSAVVEAPADLTDIAPTLLHLLGVTRDGTDGRVLTEAWDAGAETAPAHTKLALGRGFVLEGAENAGRFYPTGMVKG